MKKTIKALKIPTILLLFVTLFIACDKDFYVLDSSVLGKDNANFETDVDSLLPIVSYNKKIDSVQINNLPSNLLGFFNDPEFGATTASIITQIVPTAFNPNFGEDPIIDSVVLSIPYYNKTTGEFDSKGFPTYKLDSVYGNEDANIKLSIYENTYFLRDFNPDNLGENQNFYSHASHGSTDNFALTDNSLINFDNFKGALIKDIIFSPSAKTTVTIVDTDTLRSEPSFRVKLDIPFWEATIFSKEGGSELSNVNTFKNYFRGLYFKAEAVNGDGNMVLLNLASSEAKITIHYTKKDQINTNEREKATYSFNFTGNRLNTFINNYNIALANGNKTDGDEKLYLKGGEGSIAVVDLFGNNDLDNNKIPDALEDFIDEFRIPIGDDKYLREETTGDFILNKLINEAYLVIYEDDPINTGGDNNFHKYDRIYAYDIDNNIPTIDYLIDPTENGPNPINSKIISLSQRDTINKNYKINITEHLNNILLKDSINTKIGLVLSTNVNLVSNSEILKSDDKVTSIPTASVLSPRGTIIHGSNSSNQDKRMKIKLFFTNPK